MMAAALGLFSAGISVLTSRQNSFGIPGLTTTAGSVVTSSGSAMTASTATERSGQVIGIPNQQPSTLTERGGGPSAQSAPVFGQQSPQYSQSQSSTQLAEPQGSNAYASTNQNGATAVTVTGQDFATRMNEKLRNMQSPVTGQLDSGGVTLGDQVQNAFGHFLSGLLQTLFVEQANPGSPTN
jgi:hypothetical protein